MISKSFPGGHFFSIRQPGRHIQFANGMLLEDDRVLITYGETDSAARLASFSAERFKRAAFPRSKCAQPMSIDCLIASRRGEKRRNP